MYALLIAAVLSQVSPQTQACFDYDDASTKEFNANSAKDGASGTIDYATSVECMLEEAIAADPMHPNINEIFVKFELGKNKLAIAKAQFNSLGTGRMYSGGLAMGTGYSQYTAGLIYLDMMNQAAADDCFRNASTNYEIAIDEYTQAISGYGEVQTKLSEAMSYFSQVQTLLNTI